MYRSIPGSVYTNLRASVHVSWEALAWQPQELPKRVAISGSTDVVTGRGQTFWSLSRSFRPLSSVDFGGSFGPVGVDKAATVVLGILKGAADPHRICQFIPVNRQSPPLP